jgi:rhamnulokinase
MVQAMTAGEVGSLAEAREVIRRSFPVETFEPNGDQAQAWGDAYARFTALMA